jgi:alpha-beta hydrolase superfamily lysophospholipase
MPPIFVAENVTVKGHYLAGVDHVGHPIYTSKISEADWSTDKPVFEQYVKDLQAFATVVEVYEYPEKPAFN